MRTLNLLLLASALAGVSGVTARKQPEYQSLPPLREQAVIQDAWTAERKALIPGLLGKYDVDAWLISQREYAEETVFWSLKRATQFSARRRTTFLFLRDRDNSSAFHEYSWIDNTSLLFAELRDILERNNPQKIAINAAQDVAFASGLHAGELDKMRERLGPDLTNRFTTVPMLAVEFIATMVDSRLGWYCRLMETAWAMVDEGFSARVIVPGKTTTTDVEWWFREKNAALGYGTWFQPAVTVMNAGEEGEERVIQHGDMLHIDFGVSALGLNTDTQHLGYVLKPGETEADVPEGLLDGLKKGNRMQDIVREKMEVGRSGNDILKACLEQMSSEGIQGTVYSHPIGDWGHSAGTLIGMTNLQHGVQVLGDLPLLKNTYYSIELMAEHFVPEYNKTIRFPLEEDVFWNEKFQRWDWVYGRQESYHIIGHTTPGDDEL